MSKIKISKTENCKNSKLKFELFIFQHDSLHQCTPPQRGGNLLSNVGCSIAVRSFRSGALRKLRLAFTSNLREWPHQLLTALQNALFEMNGVQSWPVRTCMHSVHRQVSVACAALSFPLCCETWINGQCSLAPKEEIDKVMNPAWLEGLTLPQLSQIDQSHHSYPAQARSWHSRKPQAWTLHGIMRQWISLQVHLV